jgi:capsular exopolysaccharide synthesis family protein
MHLTEYLFGVVRRIWLVALLGALVAGGAYAYSRTLPRVYAASTTLLVGQSLARDQTYNQLLAAQRLSQTYAQLAATRPLAERVIQRLEITDTPAEIQAKVQAHAPTESLFVYLTVRDDDPEAAALIADALALELVAISPPVPILGPDGTPVEPLPGPNTPRMLAIVETAVPPDGPESPRTAINVVVGGMAGVALALALIFALELANDRVRNAERVRSRTGLPVLGTLTRLESPSLQRGASAGQDLADRSAKQINELVARLQFLALGTDARVFAVCGPGEGEGRTTLAALLAHALAGSGHRTLVIDGNVRQPGIHSLFGIPRAPGLDGVLKGAIPAQKAVTLAHPTLAVVPGGTGSTGAARFLETDAVAVFIRWVRNTVDIAFIDSPPLLAVTDGAHLAKAADATLLVVRPDRTTIDELAAAIDVLDRVGVRPIGVVLNDPRRRPRFSPSNLGRLLQRGSRRPKERVPAVNSLSSDRG